jgi:hypothetical protein
MIITEQAKTGRGFTLIELSALVRAQPKGRTIHPGGRCRGFLHGPEQFMKDS